MNGILNSEGKKQACSSDTMIDSEIYTCQALSVAGSWDWPFRIWFGNAFMHPNTYLLTLQAIAFTYVRVSPVALRLGSKMDPYQRDLTNILLSYLVSDSFGPVLGARAWSCKTTNDCLGLSRLRNTLETFRERCLRLPPGLLMFYIAFLLYDLMGLTILDHIYSSFL